MSLWEAGKCLWAAAQRTWQPMSLDSFLCSMAKSQTCSSPNLSELLPSSPLQMIRSVSYLFQSRDLACFRSLLILTDPPPPPSRLPSLCAVRTWSSKEPVCTSPTLSLSTIIVGKWWIVGDSGGLGVRALAVVAVQTAMWILGPLAWIQPWWQLLRQPCRVAGAWWECWPISRISQPPPAPLLAGRTVLVEIRTRVTTQAPIATTLAVQLVSGGGRVPIRALAVGSTPALDLAWRQSPAGECRGIWIQSWSILISRLYGKYFERRKFSQILCPLNICLWFCKTLNVLRIHMMIAL